MAKGSKHSLRLLLFAAFWSAKSGAKTDPPTKKAKRRGLTLAPGDYSRVCKQTVPSARAFSPHLFERLFCQAGFIRRHSGGKDASGTSKKHRSLRSPLEAGFNRRILACSGTRTTSSPRARSGRLHSFVLAAPAQRGPEVVPAKATCGWFWCYLLPPKGSYTPRHSPRFCLFGRAKKRTREQRMFAPVRMFAENRAQNRTESGPKLPAAMRTPVLNRARVSSTPSRRVP